jgi:hypothetical protein
VEGHTDDTGPPEWNQKLSVLRAEAVVEFLVGKGVERGRLTAIGHGEKLPWAPNDTESGRAKNRRVIFHIEGINSADEKREEHRQQVRARKAAHGAAAPARDKEKPGTSGDAAAPSTAGARTPANPPAPKTPAAAPTPKSPTTSPSTRTPPHPGSKTAPAPDDTSNFVPQPSPGQKKTAPTPSNPNAPPTLRDLLRLPTEH